MRNAFCFNGFNGFTWFNMGRITKADRCLIKTVKTLELSDATIARWRRSLCFMLAIERNGRRAIPPISKTIGGRVARPSERALDECHHLIEANDVWRRLPENLTLLVTPVPAGDTIQGPMCMLNDCLEWDK